MSITDDLREYALGWDERNRVRCELTTISDRIDAEHERLMQDLIDANNQIEQLCECSINLPKDADGEPIHVGDWMTPNGMDTGFKVRQMYFDGEWSLDLEGFGISQTCPDLCRHYHKPTVEGILQELTTLVWNRCRIGLTVSESGISDMVSEYAAKLRLAEEDE